jgi:type IV secretory pathway VirB2 component (pilin)
MKITLLNKTLLCLSAIALAVAPVCALAQPTPAATAANTDVNDLYKYLSGFYTGLLLPLATILAGIVIIFGGISYAASGGDPSKVQKAKELIFGAISGLVLLVTAALIVGSITG